jgi:phosphomannomutase/phosphoglucomutase
VDIDAIRRKHFKVVVDTANSVGVFVTPYLLQELGCDVMTINAHLDGHFPGRLPEPKPETLGKLSTVVKAFGADLGVSHDGDADRCIFVDDKGNVCLGDWTGAIILDYVLEKHPQSVVVTPISSSKMVEDIVKGRGSEIRWTPVGSTQVSREMLTLHSVISMEDNGGIFFGPHQPVRDGAMAAALMLEILAKRGKSLSELVALLPRYYIIKERLNCPDGQKQKVLQRVAEATEDYKRTTIDGLKLFFDDGSILLRPSGTEAIFRVFAEAKDEKRARQLADWGVALVMKSLD